jgi:hypothetical protein
LQAQKYNQIPGAGCGRLAYVKIAGYQASKKLRAVHIGLTRVASIIEPHQRATLLAAISLDAFIMFLDATMPDSDLDKKMVYLAYRNIFKDKLAKLRKWSKVYNVVEKYKDYLYYK